MPAALPRPTVPRVKASTTPSVRTLSPALSERLDLIAYPTRYAILGLLMDSPSGELNVTEIGRRGGWSQAVVSHQVALLRFHELVENRREGKFIFYRVNRETLDEVLAVVAALGGPVVKGRGGRKGVA